MIGYLGLYCLLLTFVDSTHSEIFTIFNEKDEKPQKTQNIKKVKQFPQDSFEFNFPFFNDLFPLSGLNIKPKEIGNKKKLKDNNDEFIDFMSEQETPLIDFKGNKKNGKDKLIMSFTELLIPFQNHKNELESNIKKRDIFDDIFNIFPFADFENGIFDKRNALTTKKHRLAKRKYETNIIKKINNTNLEKLFESIEGGAFPQYSRFTKIEPKFLKTKLKEETLSKTNNNETCCNEHRHCHKDGVCISHRCNENGHKMNENNENNSIKKSILLDKTFLICAIPGLIGFSALIFGIEVLRRHNELVKQTPFLTQYNQLQTC
ncbi:hypothetical protein O3M35_008216 [Rhynocoris fuscipes]|uniref:Uncharacterized protein n=1 Tax=Rhynocoris fuscipes TaxID=488301 RepID=A0AAW1D699_9HEMI